MPIALIVAFAASLGIHAAALFGPDIELAGDPEPLPPIVLELQPLPPAPSRAVVAPEILPEKPPAKRRSSPSRSVSVSATPVMNIPEAVQEQVLSALPAAQGSVDEAVVSGGAVEPASESVRVESRLPTRGAIRFRVDYGDANFEIGVARHVWEIGEGRYRLRSVVETTGLAWLLRSVSIDMESLGAYSEAGLRPDVFGVRREGRKAREQALFDWESMRIRVADRPDQPLVGGAQDLLSFYYQLGFMDLSQPVLPLPVATGKKFGMYRLENLGEETIEIPLGVLRTLHFRTSGENVNTTELWLAYDYRMLPVKIRHVDNKGGILVQVATEILFGS